MIREEVTRQMSTARNTKSFLWKSKTGVEWRSLNTKEIRQGAFRHSSPYTTLSPALTP